MAFSDVLRLRQADCKVEDLRFCSATSQLEALSLLTFPKTPFPCDVGMGDIFHSIALAHPKSVAIKAEDDSVALTYAEVDALSDVVARWAKSLLLNPGSAVAIWAENSVHFPVAVLGVLKAGLACLLLDPRSPPMRIGLILEEHSVDKDQVPILLAGKADISAFLSLGKRSIQLQDVLATKWPDANVRNCANGSTLAFYLYVHLFNVPFSTLISFRQIHVWFHRQAQRSHAGASHSCTCGAHRIFNHGMSS